MMQVPEDYTPLDSSDGSLLMLNIGTTKHSKRVLPMKPISEEDCSSLASSNNIIKMLMDTGIII